MKAIISSLVLVIVPPTATCLKPGKKDWNWESIPIGKLFKSKAEFGFVKLAWSPNLLQS